MLATRTKQLVHEGFEWLSGALVSNMDVHPLSVSGAASAMLLAMGVPALLCLVCAVLG